jgi:hypothetical protein
MIDDDVKTEFEKLDARLARVEQFLPSVATKDDLERFATKADLASTRRELEATLATKAEMREEAELTRRHFDVIAESLRDAIRIGLEGNIGVTSRVETLERQHGRLERRVSMLEAGRSRPKT